MLPHLSKWDVQKTQDLNPVFLYPLDMPGILEYREGSQMEMAAENEGVDHNEFRTSFKHHLVWL